MQSWQGWFKPLVTTTKAFCAKLTPSQQTRLLIVIIALAGSLLLVACYPYAAFSQKPLCVLLALLWCLAGVVFWLKNKTIHGLLWLNEDGELLLEQHEDKTLGQLARPYWHGSFACLLCYKDEDEKRRWLWLARDSMGQAEFCQLNVLLRALD